MSIFQKMTPTPTASAAPTMTIVAAGALTTIQDGGRKGFAAKGYPECGAADKYAMQLGNLLVGNGRDSNAAVLECTLMGASITVTQATLVALTGAVCTPTVNGVAVAMFAPLLLQAGDTLAMGTCKTGLRCYLAVYGGIAVAPVMGSRATDTKCKIGGLDGRALKAGDVLPLAITHSAAQAETAFAMLQKHAKQHGFAQVSGLTDLFLQQPMHRIQWQGTQQSPILRVVLGPQEDAFTAQGIATFTSAHYALTVDSNRMACKLKGTAIATVNGSDIISDGIVEGSIQVASDGQPIVMLADHQTTGGYAKIATVIPPDVAVLAQCRPGDRILFCVVSPQEAVQICRAQAKQLEWLEEQLVS